MKKIFLLYSFLTLTSIAVNAQEPTADQKKTIFKNVDKLLANYLEYSKFESLDAYKKFPSLFLPNVQIVDEMNPEFYYTGDKENPDACKQHIIADVLEKNKTRYSSGFSVKLLFSDVSYKQLSNGIVKLYVQKRTEGVSSDGLSFTGTSGIVLELKITGSDNTNVVINNVVYTSNKLEVSEDKKNKDYKNNEYVKAVAAAQNYREAVAAAKAKHIKDSIDAVIAIENKRIKDSTDKANALAKHRRDSITLRTNDSISTFERVAKLKDLINEPAHLWFSGGFVVGTASTSITQSNYLSNYDNTIASKSSIGSLKFNYLHYTKVDLMLHKYWGKSNDKPNFGLGIGLSFGQYKGVLKNDNFNVEYKAQDQWGGVYRQIIGSIGGINENVTINNMSIPILFSLKGQLKSKSKWGYNIEAGVVYHLNFGNTISSTTGTFNREAVYRLTGDGVPTFYDANPSYSADSWLITQQQANSHLYGTQSVQQYFTTMQQNGFNVGLSEAPKNVASNFKFASGAIGFVFSPSITYEIQKANQNPLLLTFGIHYETTSFKQNESDYKLIDEKLNYNTLMKSISTMSVSSLGAYIGLSLPLKYNKSKWNNELTSLETKQKNHQYGK